MELKFIVGIILAIIAFGLVVAANVMLWRRGIGAKLLISVITIGVSIALFIAWHKPTDDFFSTTLCLLTGFVLGQTCSLLAWIGLSSLGLVGDGGFVSELVRAAKSDSNKQANNLPDIDIKVGDYLEFGRLKGKQYGEADGSPIYWRVLNICDNKAHLIADQYVGDHVYQYDANNVGVTSASPWIGANDLRTWLNDYCLNNFFNKIERMRLVLSDDNDYVSCLSVEEAKRYFASDQERRIDYEYERYKAVLDYANNKYVNTKEGGNLLRAIKVVKDKKDLKYSIDHFNEWMGWWLRPSGSMLLQKHIPFVAADGSINYKGMHAGQSLYVRPTIWIIIKCNN